MNMFSACFVKALLPEWVLCASRVKMSSMDQCLMTGQCNVNVNIKQMQKTSY